MKTPLRLMMVLAALSVIFLTNIASLKAEASLPAGVVTSPPHADALPHLPGATDAVPAAAAEYLSLPGLKAVLIVGPIDGDEGAWTQQEITHMEWAASFLESRGVAVSRFYTPNNDWDEIVAAASGAHFLLYRGHGPAWDQVPNVGGFVLKDRMVSSREIARSLDLAPNAIVMLYACFTAGSSSADTVDIGIEEAQRRVLQYSAPFLELGVAGYYANWYGDAFEQFLRYLYTGRSLGEAYRSYFDYNPDTAHHFDHPAYADAVVWLDKDDWRGYWEYDNAFVGLPDATLPQLFTTAKLGDLPTHLRFVYSLPDTAFLTNAYAVTPRNVASTFSIPWSLTVSGSWVNVSNVTGVTPEQSFTVVPQMALPRAVGHYTGTITVASEMIGQSRDITLSLEVIDQSFPRLYVPVVTSGTR